VPSSQSTTPGFALSPGWTAVAGGLITLAHAPSFFHRLDDSDEAIYSSIAALMNAGGALYTDGGVDNKPPGIFWVYATTFRIFGTYQMTAIHVVALLSIAATCLLLFLIGRRLSSSRAGLLQLSCMAFSRPKATRGCRPPTPKS